MGPIFDDKENQLLNKTIRKNSIALNTPVKQFNVYNVAYSSCAAAAINVNGGAIIPDEINSRLSAAYFSQQYIVITRFVNPPSNGGEQRVQDKFFASRKDS